MARTIIQLIKACASKLRESKLQRLGGKEITADLAALSQRLSLEGRDEAIVFTAIFDKSCGGRPCDLEDMARYFDCAHLDIMEYIPAVRSLLARGMISIWNSNECDISSQSFRVPSLILNGLLDNRLPSLSDLKITKPEFDRYDFCRLVDGAVQDDDVSFLGLMQLASDLETTNADMTFVCRAKEELPEMSDRVLFYLVCEACPGGINLSRELRILFPINKSVFKLNEFKDEKHELQRLDLVEMRSESSIFGEYTTLVLTDKGKELYFEEDAGIFMEKVDSKNLIHCGDIVRKQLYFSENQERQLSMVGDSLQQENYERLVDRLSAKGLSKGIAVLLYGAPGTGKTESVMQWARETGRDIVHVDLSASKSMWYGESEKIVKEIFTRYRNQCKRSKNKPIFLFNEADGLFSKRKDISRGSSVDQTENTIQNILLEEMEKLDGILVATTNLATNLDSAFERRFLFKIKLEKPSVEARSHIWMDKLPSLSGEDAVRLSEAYDFSGGEIDNIVRKATMQEVLEGTAPDFDAIDRLCGEERMGRSAATRKIGF